MSRFKSSIIVTCLLLSTAVVLTQCKKKDLLPPTIVLNQGEQIFVNLNEPYVEFGAVATDNEDGIVDSTLIVIDASAVRTDSLGTYFVVYTLDDKAGNTDTKRRTVHVRAQNSDYAGTYNIVDSCVDGTVANYTVDINVGDTANYFNIENLGNFFPDSVTTNYDVEIKMDGYNRDELILNMDTVTTVSYTHLRAHETR